MYNLQKYFEEVVDTKKMVGLIKESISELNANMIDFHGDTIVTTLTSSDHDGKDFLRKILITDEEIQESENDLVLSDLVEENFENLAEDFTEFCENQSFDITDYHFEIKFNDTLSDGNIELHLVYDDFESINHLDQDEINKRLALAQEFGCYLSEVVDIDENTYQIEGIEYKVYTEDEANEAVTEYIKDSIWAFLPSFLAEMTELPIEMFEAIASNDKCESNNDALLSVVEKTCGLDAFVESAIRWDGRGHFLNSYDGEETEVNTDNETYYCYRNE